LKKDAGSILVSDFYFPLDQTLSSHCTRQIVDTVINAMSSAEDLLDHFKLDAEYRNDGEFHNGYSLHTSYISDHARGKRKEKVETKWFRQRIIGEGSFGQVWLEVQYKGEAILRKRALKVLEKRRLRLFDIDYKKELLALAKFSKSQVRI